MPDFVMNTGPIIALTAAMGELEFIIHHPFVPRPSTLDIKSQVSLLRQGYGGQAGFIPYPSPTLPLIEIVILIDLPARRSMPSATTRL